MIKSETTQLKIGKCEIVNGNQLYEKYCKVSKNTISCLRTIGCKTQSKQDKCM